MPQHDPRSRPRETRARRPGDRRQRLTRDRPGAARHLLGEVRDHIKIAHHPLLVPSPPDGGEFAGADRTGTEMVVIDDLGPDQDQAIDEFRAVLQERGET